VQILSSSCFFGKQSANRTSACCFTITALLVTVDFDKVWCQWLSICFIVTWNKKANYCKQTAHQWQTVSGKYYCDKYRVGQKNCTFSRHHVVATVQAKMIRTFAPKCSQSSWKWSLCCSSHAAVKYSWKIGSISFSLYQKIQHLTVSVEVVFFAIILKYIRQSQISPVIEDYLCTNQLKQVLTHVNYGVVSLVRLQHS